VRWTHRPGDAVKSVALAAGETPHHVHDRGADPRGADDVHAAISPQHADRRRGAAG